MLLTFTNTILPLLHTAQKYNIFDGEYPNLFDADSYLNQITLWCTSDDNPGGDWYRCIFGNNGLYVGKLEWEYKEIFNDNNEDEEIITKINLCTNAKELMRNFPNRYEDSQDKIRTIYNRKQDMRWAMRKFTWLFDQAGIGHLGFN